MAKKKEFKEVEEEVDKAIEEVAETTPVIAPIEVTFSNGDDNLLKDKINELVRHING